LGFIASKIEVKEGKSKVIDNAELPQDLLLNKTELRFILKMIKNSSFEGKDIELIFKLTWKLQEAYLSLEEDK
jgi:hypothetical protein|tara:strand:+ start:1575 stop:1793 length:219 start_codon:yes stop_codon:yes gene_type:complete